MNAKQVAVEQELLREKAALERWLDQHCWIWNLAISRRLDMIVSRLDRNGRHG